MDLIILKKPLNSDIIPIYPPYMYTSSVLLLNDWTADAKSIEKRADNKRKLKNQIEKCTAELFTRLFSL